MNNRREFITLLGGAAAWPFAVSAQQTGRVRVVGLLLASGNDPQLEIRLAAFREILTNLGWVEGQNLRIDLRYGTGSTERMQSAKALIGLAPDVLVVSSTPAAKAVRQLNEDVPIVFITVNDPVATGLVRNLTHPEYKATGFPNFEPSIAGKWVELLKEVAPRIRRIAQISDPASAAEVYFTTIEDAARALAVQVLRAKVRNVLDTVRAIDAFAAVPDGALLFPPDATTNSHREIVFQLAVEHRLPAIYPATHYAREGGLMSYGLDYPQLFRGAAIYVDRILRGAKVSELPVQFPTKFELAINLRTAKAIGLTMPPTLLARADEVIE
jgi:putative ABC transport system substrate-binding protein